MLHLLNNIKNTNCFKYQTRFDGVFSRDNLLRTKEGACVINLDGKQTETTHWVSLFIDRYNAGYFYSFCIEYIPQEELSKIKNKSMPRNIFWIQDDDFIMCGIYCIIFVEYMLTRKTLNVTNLFSLNNYKKSVKIIYR